MDLDFKYCTKSSYEPKLPLKLTAYSSPGVTPFGYSRECMWGVFCSRVVPYFTIYLVSDTGTTVAGNIVPV